MAIAAKLGVQPGETDNHITSGDHNNSRDRGNELWRKLEIPIFAGEDAFGWTQKLERYFNLKGVTDEERMQATMVALEGRALSWFQWWERCNPTPTWEGFKLAVIRRFQPSMIQNPFELLLSLKQTGTVEEFVEDNPSSKVVTIDSKALIGKKIEDSSTGNTMGSIGGKTTGEGSRNRGREFKYLTGAEMREKHEKGLCFRCDEPYHREHRCKNKQFRMIVMCEDEENEEEEEDLTMPESFKSLQLSLFSMTGFTTAKSWKVGGDLQTQSIIILIDCGASHNFISTELVERLQLSVEDTPSYVVEVGDGHKVRCRGKLDGWCIDALFLSIFVDVLFFFLNLISCEQIEPWLIVEHNTLFWVEEF
uniref:Retrotransposon gag domain-containing protein n=1 Tax=Cajanus cajan TaxID=3821 RepID=A0A151QNV2_CAJCA|nr:hypothetical protein KK1_047478 [Cajanus cajan]